MSHTTGIKDRVKNNITGFGNGESTKLMKCLQILTNRMDQNKKRILRLIGSNSRGSSGLKRYGFKEIYSVTILAECSSKIDTQEF